MSVYEGFPQRFHERSEDPLLNVGRTTLWVADSDLVKNSVARGRLSKQCRQARQPEFDPRDPRDLLDGRREGIPESCPLSLTCVHIHKYVNKCKKKNIFKRRKWLERELSS